MPDRVRLNAVRGAFLAQSPPETRFLLHLCLDCLGVYVRAFLGPTAEANLSRVKKLGKIATKKLSKWPGRLANQANYGFLTCSVGTVSESSQVRSLLR